MDEAPKVDEEQLRALIDEVLATAEPKAKRISRLGPEERQAFFEKLTPDETVKLQHDWRFWGRPSQLPPGEECECCHGQWLTWLILAGRGWGKSRTGAEWVHEQVDGRYGRLHLVGATASDARDIMIEGPAGILATQKPWNKATYQPTKRKVLWENGAVALVFSADEPERLRGEQCEAAWCDELAAWRYPEAWSQLQLGLRLGPFPRTVVTTTPIASRIIKDLAKAKTTHVTKGITYENLDHLAPAFIAEVVRVFEGTRFGRQEIYADILDDAPGALWNRALLDEGRVGKGDVPKSFDRVVVAIDPAMTMTDESSETGIIVAGRAKVGDEMRAFVLADASGKYKPDEWGSKAVSLYLGWNADAIVAEVNQGGDLVVNNILTTDPSIPVKTVRASKGKLLRAEPVSTLYERGLVHHVGSFNVLEDQMCEWEQGMDSPDRLDALVWAVTDLLVGKRIDPVFGYADDVVMPSKSVWTQDSDWRGIKGAEREVDRKPAWLS